jgi:hypothetical protein
MKRREDGGKKDDGDVMELRSPANRKFGFSRPVIDCAQCGAQIFVPDWSEYLDDCKVRHLWACEACGYSFETIARFPGGISARVQKTVAAA